MDERDVNVIVNLGDILRRQVQKPGIIGISTNFREPIGVHLTNAAFAEFAKTHEYHIFDRYPGEQCPKESYRWQLECLIEDVKFYTIGNDADFEAAGISLPAEPQTVSEQTRALLGEGPEEADLMEQENDRVRSWLGGWNEDAPDTLRDNLKEAGFGDFGPL